MTVTRSNIEHAGTTLDDDDDDDIDSWNLWNDERERKTPSTAENVVVVGATVTERQQRRRRSREGSPPRNPETTLNSLNSPPGSDTWTDELDEERMRESSCFANKKKKNAPVDDTSGKKDDEPYEQQQQGEGTSDDSSYPLNNERNQNKERTRKDDNDEYEYFELSQDAFTILFFANYMSMAFVYSVSIFASQILILCLIGIDLIEPEGTNQIRAPVNIGIPVAIAQVMALLIAIVSQDDVMVTLGGLVTARYDPSLQDDFPGATYFKFILSNALRLIEGMGVILVSFILILQTDQVIDIFMNFAAIEFVANLDDLAYTLARDGWAGLAMRRFARRIEGATIPERRHRIIGRFAKPVMVLTLLAVLLSGWIIIRIQQKTGMILQATLCKSISVTFGGNLVYPNIADNKGFQGFKPTSMVNVALGYLNDTIDSESSFFHETNDTWPRMGQYMLGKTFNTTNPPDLLYAFFSGTYVANFDVLRNGRPVYYERGIANPASGQFYYCDEVSSWVFTIPAFLEAGALPVETTEECNAGWLMKSPVTEAYGLDDAAAERSEEWSIWTGSLVLTSDFAFVCAECNRDTDCALNRGMCDPETRTCACKGGAEGDFCREDASPVSLTGYSIESDGEIKTARANWFWTEFTEDYFEHLVDLFNLTVKFHDRSNDDDDGETNNNPGDIVDKSGQRVRFYGRPLYVKTFLQRIMMIQFTGERWYIDRWFVEDFVRLFRANDLLHGYWGNMLSGSDKFRVGHSQVTDKRYPTGFLGWQTESGLGIEWYFEVTPVDCETVDNPCGFGICCQVDDIDINGSYGFHQAGIPGGKCVCSPLNSGHFCEFGDKSWDHMDAIGENDDDAFLSCPGEEEKSPCCGLQDCFLMREGDKYWHCRNDTLPGKSLELESFVDTFVMLACKKFPEGSIKDDHQDCSCKVGTGIYSRDGYNERDFCSNCLIPRGQGEEYEIAFDCSNKLEGTCVGLDANGTCISNIPGSEPFGPCCGLTDCFLNNHGHVTCLDHTISEQFADTFVQITCDSTPVDGLNSECTCTCAVGSFDSSPDSHVAHLCTSCDIVRTDGHEYQIAFNCSNKREGPCVGLDANGTCISNVPIGDDGSHGNEAASTMFEIITSSSPDNGTSLEIEGSPQSLAFEWLQRDVVSSNETTAEKIVTRYALAVFYIRTNGTHWVNQIGWLSADDECTWYSDSTVGSCDEDDRFVRLELIENAVQGELPPELGMLSHLTSIRIDNSNVNTGEANAAAILTGEIPTSLGSLKSLKELELPGNALESLPTQLFPQWNRLMSLDLSRNAIVGTIPATIGSMARVRTLNLSNNRISDKIPTEIGKLGDLKLLRLDRNELEGALPGSVGNLLQLRTLWLQRNQLTGEIPPELILLSMLHRIRLDHNNFVGQVPPNVCNRWNSTGVKSYADCPDEVECPCCSTCCSDLITGDCE